MRRELYTRNWEKVSLEIRERSGGRCECTGECGLHRGRRCVELNGQPAVWARGKIVLTVHHKNFNKRDNRRKNLIAACQRCHLRADAPMKSERVKAAQDRASGQTRLWPLRNWI